MILNTISFLFILQLSMNFKPPYPILSLLTFFLSFCFTLNYFIFAFIFVEVESVPIIIKQEKFGFGKNELIPLALSLVSLFAK